MNMMLKAFVVGAALTASSAVFAAKDATKDIVDTLAAAGNFKTLLTVIKAADWVDTLKGKEGPFTLFAPTDEAFAIIPKADLDTLMKNKAQLTRVLTYHVVPAILRAAAMQAANAPTVNGKLLTLKIESGVMVNNAKVVKTNIVASNGVIHVIDAVLMP